MEYYELLNQLPGAIGEYCIYPNNLIDMVYINDEFCRIIGKDRNEFASYDTKYAFKHIYSSDREEFLAKLFESVEKNKELDMDIRAMHGDGKYKWFNIKSKIADKNDERTLIYLLFTGISKSKKESMTTEINEQAFAIAMENEGLYTWIFDMETTECRISRLFQKKFNLPNTIYNYPECIFELNIVPKKYKKLYMNKIEELRLGAKSVEFELYMNTGNNSFHWLRFRINVIEKSTALHIKGIGTVCIIDTEKHMSARIKKEQDRINHEDNSLTAYTISDLTHGTIMEYSQYAPNAPVVEKTHNYSENIEEALGSVVYEDDKKEFTKIHNVEYLIDAFNKGKTAINFEFRRRHRDGMISWVRNVLHMLEDPDTKNIMLYEYCYDINSSKSVEVVTNAAIIETFDCLSSIDLVHDQTTYLSQENIRIGKNVVLDIYSDVCNRYINDKIIESEKELCRAVFSINNIKHQLEKRENFEFTYHIIDEIGKEHIMRNKYVYYDKKKFRCLLMRTDVTEIVTKEEEERHRLQLAEVIDSFPGGLMTFTVDIDENMRNKCIYCAKGVAELAGYDVETFTYLYDNYPNRIIFASDLAAIHKQMLRLVETGEPLDITYRAIHKNGEYFWVHERANSLTDTNGERIMVAVFQNVSDDVKMYQNIIDHSKNIIQVIDRESRKVYYANKAAIDFAGRSDYSCLHCYEFFGKRSDQCPFCNYINGQLYTKEINIKNRVYTISGMFMKWHGRDVFVEILVDITKHKEMQKHYESYISTITQTTSNAIISGKINVTKNQCVQLTSKLPLFDSTSEDITIDGFVEYATQFIEDKNENSNYRNTFKNQNLIEEYRKGNNLVSVQHHNELHDGRMIIMCSNVQMMLNPETGEIEGVFYAMDITKDVINQLMFKQLSKRGYEQIVIIDTISKTCTIHNIDGIDENDAPCMNFDETTNALKNNIIHSSDRDLYLKICNVDYLKKELDINDVFSCQLHFQTNGEIRVKRYSFCYFGDVKSSVMELIEDVTDIVRESEKQKEELKKALDIARNATKAKSDFLSRMSHDMRTPMNGIMGMTKLTQDLKNLPNEAINNLSSIEESSNYLLGLINDTLDMSKIENNLFVLNPEVVCSDELIKNIIANITPQAEKKNITIEFVPINAELEYIYIDRVRVQQIYLNILSNAVKFSKKNGKIRIEIECLKRENDIAYDRISVEDNGIGMSEEFLKHVYEPFVQEEEYSAKGMVGTGLGLSIVKKLVDMMGGRMEIESKKGVGTKVTVYINFKRVYPEKNECKQIKTESKINFKGRNFLLVEDHPLNAKIAVKLLEKMQGRVYHAQNGKIGVEKFQESDEGFFDAVLMDIRMPIMNGIEAAKCIRELKRDDAKKVPIIAMTANAFDDDKKEASEAGMNAHLSKPIKVEVLYETINELIK